MLTLGLSGACSFGVVTDPTTTFGGPPTSGAVSATEAGTGGASSGDGSTGGVGSTGDADGTTGAPPGTSTSTGSEGESSGDDTGPVNCTNMTTCAAAEAIGGVSGDQASPSLDAMGDEPTWLAFEVSENDNSVIGSAMSFTAILQSPAAADFDLVVYRGVEGGNSGCGGFMQQSVEPGAAVDMVSMSWGEGAVANNSDDGVWVAVEVRAKNDVCAPPEQWMLTVHGNG